MDATQVEQNYRSIQKEMSELQVKKQKEIELLEAEKYFPLITEANRVKAEINSEITNKYNEAFDFLNKELTSAKELLDSNRIDNANQLWYPKGTTVYLWEYIYDSKVGEKVIKRTTKTGVVHIYDGTQQLASVNSYSLPKIGDVIVIHNKKDGPQGLKFDIVSEYGVVKSYKARWYSESDTPKDNIETRAEKEEAEEQYKF